jgi:hypothetical protein
VTRKKEDQPKQRKELGCILMTGMAITKPYIRNLLPKHDCFDHDRSQSSIKQLESHERRFGESCAFESTMGSACVETSAACGSDRSFRT